MMPMTPMTPREERLANETECEIIGHCPGYRSIESQRVVQYGLAGASDPYSGLPYLTRCLKCGVRLLVLGVGQSSVRDAYLAALNTAERTVVVRGEGS